MGRIRSVLLTGAMVLMPATLAAQDWHVPRFMPPAPGHELAVYSVDTSPWGWLEGNWAIMADWRRSGDFNLGLRLGYQDYGDNVSPAAHYVAGVDTWYAFLRTGSGAPIDAAVTLGVGASWGDGSTWITMPVGVSVAREFSLGELTLVPYVHPFIAPEPQGLNLDENLGASLGLDIRLGQYWAIRADVVVPEEALGFGIVRKLR